MMGVLTEVGEPTILVENASCITASSIRGFLVFELEAPSTHPSSIILHVLIRVAAANHGCFFGFDYHFHWSN